MRNGNAAGLSDIEAEPAGQEAGVFLAVAFSCVCVTMGMSLPSELFLHVSHGAPLAPRASELHAYAGARGRGMKNRRQKAGDAVACPCPALPWMLLCSDSPGQLFAEPGAWPAM